MIFNTIIGIVAAAASASALSIAEIQGPAWVSPYAGQTVKDIRGVVTVVDVHLPAIYIQSLEPDNDPALLKLSTSTLLQTNLQTSLENMKDVVKDGEAAIPEPIKLESIENMYIEVTDPLVTARSARPGQLSIVPTPARTPSDRFLLEPSLDVSFAVPTDFSAPIPQRATLPAAVMGDILTSFKGTISWRTDSWRLRSSTGNIAIAKAKEYVEPIAKFKKERSDCSLVLASYNIENFWAADGTNRALALARHVTKNLATPDLVLIQELADDDGNSTGSGLVSSDKNLQVLIDAITTVGGPKYEYLYIAPNNGSDGGAPGLNIRNAYLYNPARLSLPALGGVGGTDDTQEVLKSTDGSPSLKYNPGRIDPLDTAWDETRKPLSAQFEFNGRQIFVVNNHMSSKSGSGLIPFGNIQPAVNGQHDRRVLQAKSFYFVGAMKTLVEETSLYNLHDLLPVAERFTYAFDGYTQTIDHFLVPKCDCIDSEILPIHVNNPGPLVVPRISDHDALVAQIDICKCGQKPPSTTTASAPASTTTPCDSKTSTKAAATSTTTPCSTATAAATVSTATAAYGSTTTAKAPVSSTTPCDTATKTAGVSTTTAKAPASSTTPCDKTTTTAKAVVSTGVYDATKSVIVSTTTAKAPASSTTPCDKTTTTAKAVVSTGVYDATKPVIVSTTKAPVSVTTPCDTTTAKAVVTTKAPVSTEAPCDDEDDVKPVVPSTKPYSAPPSIKTGGVATPIATPKTATPASTKNLVVSGAEKNVVGFFVVLVACVVAAF
ncbi:Endonuclease/exonuclease/phosphatase [Chytridium lagenaria]|nr:Endonuclease/exonuclease/phosphatase [Chytridium lagenaria]